MSLSYYESIQGLQVKRDHDYSNLTLECDAVPVYPTSSTRHVERNSGKIAVEVDICDLEVAKLIVHGVAEICDIFCPVDFNVTAGNNVNVTADNDITLSAIGPGTGDIQITNVGAGSGAFLDLDGDDGITLRNAASATTGVNSTILLSSRHAAGQNAIQLLAQHPTTATLPGGDIALDASVGDIFLSAGGTNSLGDVTISAGGTNAVGNVSVTASNDVTITAGSGTLASHIALDTSANTTTVLEVEVGTVTQATNQTTAVISNSVSGIITLAQGTIVQDTTVVFILNNTKIAADSLILLSFETVAALPPGSLLMANVVGPPGPAARIQISNVGSATTGLIAPGKVHFLVLNPVA